MSDRQDPGHDATGIVNTVRIMAVVGIVIALLVGLTGCAGLYVRAGLGLQDDSNTDYWEQTDRDWQCENPAFRAEAGWESKRYEFMGLPLQHGVSYWHDSWLSCGTGFNERPESYSNGYLGWIKAGGR